MAKSIAKPKGKRDSRTSGAHKPTPKATTKATRKAPTSAKPAARQVDKNTSDQGDWREKTLDRMRALILEADPAMIEERKWRKPSNAMAGVPVWSHHGIVCTGETYKQVVKLTFAQGAKLPDPARLFNSSLEGNTRRAIDIHAGEQVNAAAFKTLIKAAVAHNSPPAKKAKSSAKKSQESSGAAPILRRAPTAGRSRSKMGLSPSLRAKQAQPSAKQAKSGATNAKKIKLLSGGNPQIAKSDGDAPVQAYIAAMPNWKGDVGRRLDALIVRAVPNVRKAVKWNTPFYGLEDQGFFLGFHCITKYIKVAFFRGTSLLPLPPVKSGQKEVRYFHIHEDDQLDAAQFTAWVKQAAALPGWLA